MERLIIYQMFPRIFSNATPDPVPWGTLERNGAGKLNDLTSEAIKSVKELGVNCIWLTGVIEHATKSAFPEADIPADNPNVVKGEAGSPYAIKDYYDIDPAIAVNVPNRMREFEQCVKRIHKEEMKVLIDFVPNHTARAYHSDCAPVGVKDFGVDDDITMGFSPSNNYYYTPFQQFAPSFPLDAEGKEPYVEFPAKATGNDCFTAFCSKNDWYETVKLNYGHDYGDWSDHFDPIPDTWIKMLAILRFWASKGIDGFRCDMCFMVPLPFWHWAIPQVKKDYPDIIFIGEIYDVAQYRPFLDYGCFDYLYDKVNLYDTLVNIEINNYSAACLTGAWQTVDGISDRMLNFLENHDEVRFGSKAYSGNPANVLPSLVVSSMMSKSPFMIYYGQELGESANDNEGFAGDNNRSTIFDYWSYDILRRWWNNGHPSVEKLTAHEKWLRDIYRKTLTLCNSEPALREGNFFDLMYVNLRNPGFNPHRQFAFLRYTADSAFLIVVNFDFSPAEIQVKIPRLAFEMSGIKEGNIVADDVLCSRSVFLNLRPDAGTRLRLNSKDAAVLRIR